MNARVRIKRQDRRSLAMKVTPAGVLVLIPRHLAADSPQVQAFVRAGLDRLQPPDPVPAAERLDQDGLRALVDAWAGRLGVAVGRVQFRKMRAKWGSMSTRGTLTLASDLARLPRRLAEYVVCHELLHLQVPNHNGAYRLLLRRHMPDWQERERELGRWVLVLCTGE